MGKDNEKRSSELCDNVVYTFEICFGLRFMGCSSPKKQLFEFNDVFIISSIKRKFNE